MTAEGFSALPGPEAIAGLLTCCGSRTWAEAVAAGRPFSSREAMLEAADQIWFGLAQADWLEAFAQHPRIGERKDATTAYLAHSSEEQAAAQRTLDEVGEALIAGNRAYEARFGFRYIVFASGRTAAELLAVLQERLTRTRDDELLEAARQQHRITTLRMAKLLEEAAFKGAAR